jgi:hypothetical protein
MARGSIDLTIRLGAMAILANSITVSSVCYRIFGLGGHTAGERGRTP